MKKTSDKKKKPILLELANFIVKPGKHSELYKKRTKATLKRFFHNLFDFIRIWSLQLFLTILFGLIALQIASKLKIDTSQNAIDDIILEMSPILVLAFSVIYAPITEELSFRGLLKPNIFVISISIPFIGLTLIQFLMLLFPILETIIPEQFYNLFSVKGIIFYAAFLLISLGIGYVTNNFLKVTTPLQKFYKKNLWWIYYASAISFGVLHITNYLNFRELIWITPLLIAPQLTVGLLLGFVRVKYSLSWAILGHMLHNLILVTPILIMLHGTDSYRLIMENPELNLATMLNLKDSILYLGIFSLGIFLLLLVLIFLGQMVAELLIYYFANNSLKINESEKS